MCGICGFNWDDKELIRVMLEVMGHRGPDHTADYIDKDFSLGYNRLSIIDLDGGNQPIYNEEGNLVLFFNGEIYNYKELRKKLEEEGHEFTTDTDSEVVVHAYEKYGKSCVKRFNGMFAFVIYDTDKKELFLARDRLGIKPLFYYHNGKKFMFASEIKSILQYSEIDKKIDIDSLNNYLTFRYCPGQNTMLEKINKAVEENTQTEVDVDDY